MHTPGTAEPAVGDTVPTVSQLPADDRDDLIATMTNRVQDARSRSREAGGDLHLLPKRLSPSRAADFKQCPQMFYYKTIVGLREPSTEATVRGTLAHTAFERIFDHPEGERTPDIAVGYIRPAWQAMLHPDLAALEGRDRDMAAEAAADASTLFTTGSEEEEAFLLSTEAVVRSWFDMERVNNFTPTDLELPDGTLIDGREYHAQAEVAGVTLHGFIDRLDQYRTRDGRLITTVSDYKTGKALSEGKQYSDWMMNKIREDKFFQLKVYALLMWEMHRLPVNTLRLLFVKTGSKEKGIETYQVTRRVIESTRNEIRTLWKQIQTSARTGRWATSTGPLCNYCYFKDICPAFATADSDVNGILAEDRERRRAS